MGKLAALLASCTLVLTAQPASAQVVTIGEQRIVKSTLLGEDRQVWVYLPPSYQSRKHGRYPVLYFLDGAKFFHAFTGAVQHLSSDATPQIPEMILVGIVSQQRVRDSSPTHSLRGFSGKVEQDYESSGGSAAFLRFMREELVPWVEREYRVTKYRIFCGYSFTGLAVLDALFSHPPDFDAYLVIDPSWWWDDYVMEKRAAQALAGAVLRSRQLFVATSGEAYPERFFPKVRNARALEPVLKAAKPRGLDWSFRHYADESHHSFPLRAAYDGLCHFFRGYKPSLHALYSGDPALLEKQYAALSQRLGTKIFLREELVNWFGYQFMGAQKDEARSLAFFQMNTRQYPDSSNAWDSLGEALALRGDKAAAIKAYEQALALDGGNANAAARLTELQK